MFILLEFVQQLKQNQLNGRIHLNEHLLQGLKVRIEHLEQLIRSRVLQQEVLHAVLLVVRQEVVRLTSLLYSLIREAVEETNFLFSFLLKKSVVHTP